MADKADDWFVVIAAEAAKFINTHSLKSLFQWAEQITDTTNHPRYGILEQSFAIHQYLTLWMLNKIDRMVNNHSDHNQDRDLYFDDDLYFLHDFGFDRPLYWIRDDNFYRDFDSTRVSNLQSDILGHLIDPSLELYVLCSDLPLYFELYNALDIELDLQPFTSPNLYIYQDFYQYIGTEIYSLLSPELGDLLDKELQERVKVVQRIEQMKIFKGVDLQQMAGRFNAQREFIKAAGKGKTVKPPAESIHDTWISVLGITNDVLEISDEEVANYFWYLWAVQLLLACMEAAGLVSPEMWQKIEAKLLASGT